MHHHAQSQAKLLTCPHILCRPVYHYPQSQAKNPWKISAYNGYRQKLYTQTAAWLRNRGGPTYRVDGLYMWNAGSWDALGVHYATANSQGSWADAKVQATVKAHNAAVNKAK